jgi:tetratricopeptide (TPR) repeat protein
MQYTLSQLAWALDLLGKSERSLELLRVNEYISKNRDDTLNLLIGLQYQAGINSLPFFDRIDLYHQQQHLCRELGEKANYWLQISIGNEGGLLFALGLLDLAYSMYLEKERICREINNYQGLSWALGWQGRYFTKLKNYDRALELLQEQYEIAKSISYFRGIESSLEDQKTVFKEKNDNSNAIRVEKELDILKKSHVSIDYVIPPTNDEIFQKFSTVCELKEMEYTKSGNQQELSRVLGLRGIIAEVQNDFENADYFYKKQEEIGNFIHNQVILDNAWKNMWRLNWRNKKFLAAEEIYNEHNMSFVKLWENYEFIEFLDGYIQNSVDNKNYNQMEALLKKQRKYSQDFSLSIPVNSLYYHYIQARSYEDVEHLKWLYTKKPEFDILLQFLMNDKKRSQDHSIILNLLEVFGKVDYYKGDFQSAISCFNSLKGTYGLLGDNIAKEKTLGHIGLANEAMGEFGHALSFYMEQERMCREFSLDEDLLWALCNIGDVQRKSGDLNKAYEYYSLLESASRVHDPSYWLKTSLINLGDIHKDWGEFNSALSFYQKSEKISITSNYSTKLLNELESQADINYSMGNFDLALEFYNIALQTCSIPATLFDQWRILTKISVLHDTLGNTSQFLNYLERKRKLITVWNHEIWFAQLLLDQDHLHKIRFDLVVMYEWYKKRNVLKILLEKQDTKGLPQSLYGLYSTIESIISTDEIKEFSKFGDLCLEKGFKMGIQYFYGFRGLHELMAGDLKSALLSFTAQKELCEKIGYKEGLQMAIGMIADINYTIEEYVLTKSLSDEQKTLAIQLGARVSVLNCNQRLLDSSIKRRDVKQAKEFIDALANATEIGSFYHIMTNLFRKGLVYHLEGKREEEVSCYKEQERLSGEHKDKLFAVIASLKLNELSSM